MENRTVSVDQIGESGSTMPKPDKSSDGEVSATSEHAPAPVRQSFKKTKFGQAHKVKEDSVMQTRYERTEPAYLALPT